MSKRPKFLNEAVLEHHYKSGSFKDWSGNGNDGTPDNVYFTGKGLKVNPTNGNIVVNDSPELRLTSGSIVVFTDGGFEGRIGSSQILLEKRGATTNYSFLINSAGTLAYYDGTVQRNSSSVASVVGKKYLACNFADGQNVEVFADENKETIAGGVVDVIPQTENISIGNLFSKVLFYADTGMFVTVLIFPRKLTDSEHAQLYGYLSSLKWPTKLQTISHANLTINRDDPSFVAGWDMEIQSGKLLDVGPNKVDGTIVGNLMPQETLLGKSLFFDGDGYVNLGDRDEFKIDEFTISCWVKPLVDVIALEMIIGSGNAHWYFGITNPNRIIFSYYDIDPAQITLLSSNNAIKGGVWNHIAQTVAVVGSNVTLKTYANGILVNDVINTNGWRTNYGSDWAIGRFSTSFKLNGNLNNLVFHNEAKEPAWVQQEYAKGAVALYQSGFGVNESVVNQTSILENSPWKINSGSFKVVVEDVNGMPTKVVKCISSGTIVIPTAYLRQSESEAAYGDFLLYINKADDSNLQIQFICDNAAGLSPSGNGYEFRFTSTEGTQFYLVNAGSYSTLMAGGDGAYGAGVWHRLRHSRKNNGEFSIKMNNSLIVADVSGSNPVTNNAKVISTHVVIVAGTGDKFANFTKRLIAI